MITLARGLGRTFCWAGILAAAPLAGQAAPWNADRAGGEDERYLRTLQVASEAEVHPWSIRAFSGVELGRILPENGDVHPWDAHRADLPPNRFHLEILPPRTRTHLNTGFAYTVDHTGPWAGRGLSSLAAAGVRAQLGPLSIRLEPEVAWAQNAEFDLRSNGLDGDGRFADPRFPRTIDLPQRFGEDAFARGSPGESTARIDLVGLTAGVSTARQAWGPGERYPLLMGGPAPGYAHAFLGTSRPLDLRVLTVHGRSVWGVLHQSEFSPMDGDGRRFTPAVVAVVTTPFLPGLEVGGGRFFHIEWRDGGPTLYDALRPFEAFLKVRRGGGQAGGADEFSTPDNQLASAFARWVLPGSGFEAWGEIARNDHSWDLRDLALQPDHDFGFSLGARKVWRHHGGALTALRGEMVDGRMTHLAKVRPQVPFYIHSRMRQGHTHRGQLLGSPAAYGGLGHHIALDRYDRTGRWTVSYERLLRDDQRAQQNQFQHSGIPRREAVDVQHILDFDLLRFLGPFEVNAGAAIVYNLNRDFRGDAWNLNLRLGGSWVPTLPGSGNRDPGSGSDASDSER